MRAGRIAFDVAAESVEGRVRGDGERSKSSLVDRTEPARAAHLVDALRVQRGHAMQQAGDVVRLAGVHEEVPMVGHQTPRVELDREARLRVGEQRFEPCIVVLAPEERGAVGAAVQDVDGRRSEARSGAARHVDSWGSLSP